MARSHGKGKKNDKFSNPCYYNHCHHGDKTPKKTKPWNPRLLKCHTNTSKK